MDNIVIRTENIRKSYKKGTFAMNGLNITVKDRKIQDFLDQMVLERAQQSKYC